MCVCACVRVCVQRAAGGALGMPRINGAASAVREYEERERVSQQAHRVRSRSVAGFQSEGYSAFGGHWSALDEMFPSQPRRFALSVATDRTQTAKAPRGPTLRGPRTWMRHQYDQPLLPEAVAELDRYYTGVQNPIGRSAGTGKTRSSSERVVLAIAQSPDAQWHDDQAGPSMSAKRQQGSLLILKVSSGSVQNWRRVKQSGATRSNDVSRTASPAQHQQQPIDMPTQAATQGGRAVPAAAHLVRLQLPEEYADQGHARVLTDARHLSHKPHADGSTVWIVESDSVVSGEGAIALNDPSKSHAVDVVLNGASPSRVESASKSHSSSVGELSPTPTAHTTHIKRPHSRGILGSRLGATAANRSTTTSRILTESVPSWRNTPSWESSGWYSRGSLIDSATDAQVAPVIYRCICTHICIYIYIFVCVYICVCVYIYRYIYRYMYRYIHMYVCVYIFMYTYIYIYIFTYIYIHI